MNLEKKIMKEIGKPYFRVIGALEFVCVCGIIATPFIWFFNGGKVGLMFFGFGCLGALFFSILYNKVEIVIYDKVEHVLHRLRFKEPKTKFELKIVKLSQKIP
jgi:hypothetical protein